MADIDPIPALIADLRRWSAELAAYQDTYEHEQMLMSTAADALASLSAQLREGTERLHTVDEIAQHARDQYPSVMRGANDGS